MSLVAPRTQPQLHSPTHHHKHTNGHIANGVSKPSLNGLSSSLPTSATAHGKCSLLKDMLATEMRFGDPVGKTTWDLGSGVREILPGPRSPKMNGKSLPNGHGKHHAGEEAKEGRPDSDEDNEEVERPRSSAQAEHAGPSSSSSTTLVGPTLPAHLATPTRKGKEPATPSSKTSTPLNGGSTMTKMLHEDPIDLSWPTNLRTRKASSAGLHNPSMACYANATLQVLLHTPPVLRIAQTHETAHCRQMSKKGWCMLCALKKLVQVDHWGTKRAYQPREVHNSLSHIKKGFSKNRQEDTHEFFRFVTDALQNTALCGTPKDLPVKIKHTTWVYQTWGGEVRSRVVCSKCRKPSDTFDNFLDLSLDMPKGSASKSVTKMLEGFIKEDKLEGDNKYYCDNCKSKANATKSFKIMHAPPVLTLHLKRFAVNYGWNGKPRANKNTQFIEYPEKLDIADYMVDPESTDTRYRLFGVTCHRGSELRFGHYTSYVRGPSGKWFNADDDDVTEVKSSRVLSDSSAYLLSYIRVSDTDASPSQSTGTSSQTATPRMSGLVDGYLSPTSPAPSAKRRRLASVNGQADDRDADENSDIATPIKPLSPSSPAYAPSDDEEEESIERERTPRKWAFEGNKKKRREQRERERLSGIHAPMAKPTEMLKHSPIDRPSHPSPGGRAERRRDKRKRPKGAPQPFKMGSSPAGAGRDKTGGFRRSGLASNLKPRQRHPNGRSAFRG